MLTKGYLILDESKAVMMVILTMLMMKRLTSMTMTEIMMVMTMMVVMLHITDFLLKRRKRNRFKVCLFFLFCFFF